MLKIAIKDGAENIWEFAEGLINDSVERNFKEGVTRN